MERARRIGVSEREISIPTVAARCLCLLCSLARLLCVSFFFAGTTATQTQKSKLNFTAPINGEIFMQKSTTGWSVIGWLGCGTSLSSFLGCVSFRFNPLPCKRALASFPLFRSQADTTKQESKWKKKRTKAKGTKWAGGDG